MALSSWLAHFFTYLFVDPLLSAFIHASMGPYLDHVTDTRETTSQQEKQNIHSILDPAASSHQADHQGTSHSP